MNYISGAIENPKINQAIVNILEGTMPAFHNRQDKYQPVIRRKRSRRATALFPHGQEPLTTRFAKASELGKSGETGAFEGDGVVDARPQRLIDKSLPVAQGDLLHPSRELGSRCRICNQG
jgi:hypothetical protein